MKLLLGDEWYHPVDPAAHPEWSFERLLIDQAYQIFPEFHLAEMKARLRSPLGNVKADFVLVERRFRRWYLVEVERVDHSLFNHVLPQAEKIACARPDPAVRLAIERALPEVDPIRLRKAITDLPHDTLVLANGEPPGWREALARLRVGLAVVELFRNRLDRMILRVNGDQPQGGGEHLTMLEPAPGWLSVAFRVLSPAALGEGDSLPILTDAGIEKWSLQRIKNEVLLFPSGRMPAEWGRAELYEAADGGISIRRC